MSSGTLESTASVDYGNNDSVIDNDKILLPRELIFTDDTLVSVIIYSVLFCIAAIGNVSVFATLVYNRHRKSRVNMFIMNLCMADMIVTFVMMPMEIGWHLTVSWTAGDFACRFLMFFRAFGFYLSSLILIAISLDRYFAVAYPLDINDAKSRGKRMLCMSWFLGAIASAPQCVIFHEEAHPDYPWYKQCVTFNFFPSTKHELAYNLFNVIMLYILPLLAIVIVYSMIVYELTKKSRETSKRHYKSGGRTIRNDSRASGKRNLEKARNKTMKLTIVIVVVFIVCWTPYFVISAWWWFDRNSAEKINPKIARGMFIFAVSNSCMNPIVYGMFTNTFQREVLKLYHRLMLVVNNNSFNTLTRTSVVTNISQPHIATARL